MRGWPSTYTCVQSGETCDGSRARNAHDHGGCPDARHQSAYIHTAPKTYEAHWIVRTLAQCTKSSEKSSAVACMSSTSHISCDIEWKSIRHAVHVSSCGAYASDHRIDVYESSVAAITVCRHHGRVASSCSSSAPTKKRSIGTAVRSATKAKSSACTSASSSVPQYSASAKTASRRRTVGIWYCVTRSANSSSARAAAREPVKRLVSGCCCSTVRRSRLFTSSEMPASPVSDVRSRGMGRRGVDGCMAASRVLDTVAVV